MSSKLTVLVVEDEPLIRLALVSALEDEDYAVVEARTVLQAIAMLAKYDVHAVVTDVDMPGGLSGLDLVDMVAGFSRTMGIIVTSGRAIPPENALPAGVIFLSKPYALETVVAELASQLRTRPAAMARR
ncbi:response regulator [Rhizobium sp. TH2]|uniref:response regulator n=2 Tax=Rhizobium sp. TH2 TaxID=2775403 RepID=UPI002157AC6D|nr:response regulator [Rhizobium sp. TH2]UVC08956.1 response regulator [Rhizobium sp. TH2]